MRENDLGGFSYCRLPSWILLAPMKWTFKPFSDYEIIFIIWAAMGSFIVLTKLILFSPNQLPEIITEEKPYSLMENSLPLQLCCKQTPKNIAEPKNEDIDLPDVTTSIQKSNPLTLFKDVKFYVIWVSHSVFVLRLGKHQFSVSDVL